MRSEVRETEAVPTGEGRGGVTWVEGFGRGLDQWIRRWFPFPWVSVGVFFFSPSLLGLGYLVLLFSAEVRGENWLHAHMHAVDGTHIHVDVAKMEVGGRLVSDHIWIHVQHPSWRSGQRPGRVRVIFMNYRGDCGQNDLLLIRDFELGPREEGKRFDGTVPLWEPIELWGTCQEVSVEVDGKWWMRNSQNHSRPNNFRFNMQDVVLNESLRGQACLGF